ncbi:MAG: LysR family transcriptional regulator [Reyranellaceae bacterium]
MELRQLRYFIAIAEEGSFTKAAARLHLSQPPLSQQIKSLESELGVQLFRRMHDGALLTEAGQCLLREARKIVGQVNYAMREVVQTGAGEKGKVRLGSVGAAFFSVLPLIVEHITERLPEIELELIETGANEQIAGLERGEIDLGIVHLPIAVQALEQSTIFSECYSVILPLGHPLSGSETLDLASLAQERFILFPRERAPALYDNIVAVCQDAGLQPHVTHHCRQLSAIVQMVSLGLGMTVVPRSLHRACLGRVAVIDLPDSRPAELGLIWRAPETSATRNIKQRIIDLTSNLLIAQTGERAAG